MNENLEDQAKSLDQVVAELEKAIAHAKIAAAHFRSGEVPRGCAHTFAIEGHMSATNDHIREMALAHRIKAGT